MMVKDAKQCKGTRLPVNTSKGTRLPVNKRGPARLKSRTFFVEIELKSRNHKVI